MGLEAVLFDFGGVLIDSPFDAFAAYERRHGLRPGFLRSLNATDPDANSWARLERAEIGFDEFCEAFDAEAEAAGGVLDARELFATLVGNPRPSMVEALRRCRTAYRTGLLTNNFLTPLGGTRFDDIVDLFDVVVESARAGIRKPDPDFYRLACDELGIEPNQAVFLDDLGVNLKPARELGMHTIKVVDPEAAIAELESLLGIALRADAP